MEQQTIDRVKAVLTILSSASAPMLLTEVGDRTGLSAQDMFSVTKVLTNRELFEKPDEKKNGYQISQKGKEFLANPPAATPKKPKPPSEPPKEPPKELPKELPKEPPKELPKEPPLVLPPEDSVIPSQADIFRSIAQQLGITKAEEAKGGTALEGIINFVERTADMDDLDSIEKALIGMNVPAHIRKRWLTLYAQSLPTKDRHMSPELAKMLDLEGKEEKQEREKEKEAEKPKTQMYNVIEDRIFADPNGEFNFSQAIQQMMVNKGTSAKQAADVTTALANAGPNMLTTLLPLLTKETPPPPPPDTTLFQSLQVRIEQLADERNKAQLDALRAEMRAGQRPPEADAQIQGLAERIETLRDDLHTQQLERLKDQHKATIDLLTDKMDRLDEQVRASITGKQVDSKYGLMSEGLKGILNEIGGARTDIKAMVPTFLQRGREKPVRTSEQKADFDRGLEQAIESQKKSREMEDKLFFGKEG